MNDKFCILVKILLKFVPKGTIDNNTVLVEIMARQQAIIWSNADLIHWCIYVALKGDDLKMLSNHTMPWQPDWKMCAWCKSLYNMYKVHVKCSDKWGCHVDIVPAEDLVSDRHQVICIHNVDKYQTTYIWTRHYKDQSNHHWHQCIIQW